MSDSSAPTVGGLVLVTRHSESEFWAQGRWAGWLDPPLTQRGLASADQAAQRWAGFGVDAVVSSDLTRAWQGADRIARSLGVPLLPASRDLRERHAGRWQGKLLRDLEADPAYRNWVQDSTQSPPGGEGWHEFWGRLSAALRGLAGGGKTVLAVTHDGVQRCVAWHLGVPAADRAPLTDAVAVALAEDGSLRAAREVVA